MDKALFTHELGSVGNGHHVLSSHSFDRRLRRIVRLRCDAIDVWDITRA